MQTVGFAAADDDNDGAASLDAQELEPDSDEASVTPFLPLHVMVWPVLR